MFEENDPDTLQLLDEQDRELWLKSLAKKK
jgi:hypothetical protein